MTREHHHDCGVPCPALIYTPWCPCWCHEPTKEDSEMSTLLERMIAETCKSFTGPLYGHPHTCPEQGKKVHQYCYPCKLRAALAEDFVAGVQAQREAAVTKAYNAVTGTDDEGWNPDRTLSALHELWDAAHQAALAEGGVTYVRVSSEDIRRTQELAWDEGHFSSAHENPYRKAD